MGATDTSDTWGTRPAATARRPHSVPPGQAYIFIALAMPLLCGMLALAVDVGTTTARYQALQHAAENAAEAGAYALYGSRIGATASLTDTGVWNAMASKLTAQGLTVMNAPGGSVPRNPCTAGYRPHQAAMSATYLDAIDTVIITTTTPRPGEGCSRCRPDTRLGPAFLLPHSPVRLLNGSAAATRGAVHR